MIRFYKCRFADVLASLEDKEQLKTNNKCIGQLNSNEKI